MYVGSSGIEHTRTTGKSKFPHSLFADALVANVARITTRQQEKLATHVQRVMLNSLIHCFIHCSSWEAFCELYNLESINHTGTLVLVDLNAHIQQVSPNPLTNCLSKISATCVQWVRHNIIIGVALGMPWGGQQLEASSDCCSHRKIGGKELTNSYSCSLISWEI
jgi:hypothetical protein